MKILLIILLALSACQTSAQVVTHKAFKMYHDIKYIDKPTLPLEYSPALNKLGASPIEYWDSGDNINIKFPSEKATKDNIFSRERTQNKFYYNIEHLPNRYRASSAMQQLKTIQKITSIAQWTREQRPEAEIGFYSMVVETKYFYVGDDPEYTARNKRFSSLATFVDVIYLDMYTTWEERYKWERALRDTVAEARKLNKPVIVFIWPQYHQASPTVPLQLIDGDFWRMQLEQIYKQADGLIIWTGGCCQWSDMADETDPNNWWAVTLDFMQKKGL